MDGDPQGLRDEIVRLLLAEMEEADAPEPATAAATDEINGAFRAMVIDEDANGYRITVEAI